MKNLFSIFSFVVSVIILSQAYNIKICSQCENCQHWFKTKIKGNLLCNRKPSPNTWVYYYWKHKTGEKEEVIGKQIDQSTGYFDLTYEYRKSCNNDKTLLFYIYDGCNTRYYDKWVLFEFQPYMIRDVAIEQKQYLEFQNFELSNYAQSRASLNFYKAKLRTE